MANKHNHWQKNSYPFLMSQFLTGITSMIVQYAIIWYLTKETGSATILSIATILGMLPMVLLSPLVGPLVDRWNKKYLLIIPDIIAAGFAVMLSICGITRHTLPLWLIFISLLVRSCAQTFQMPTVQAIMPTIVPESRLTKMNGQLGMIQAANLIIAPSLGAFLFALVPIEYLILLDVLGAIMGIIVLAWVNLPNTPRVDQPLRVLQDVKFGVGKLFQNKGLWYITLIGTAFMLAYMPAASMYPLMTIKFFHGTVSQSGFIEAVYSIGMLIGSGIISFWGNWRDRMKPIIAALFLIGLPTGISAVLPDNQTGFIWFAVLNVIEGIAIPFFTTLLMALIQQSYPATELGRVLGVFNAFLNLAGPIGLIFAGPIADLIGIQILFFIAGSAATICGAAALLISKTRQYDIELQKKRLERTKMLKNN